MGEYKEPFSYSKIIRSNGKSYDVSNIFLPQDVEFALPWQSDPGPLQKFSELLDTDCSVLEKELNIFIEGGLNDLVFIGGVEGRGVIPICSFSGAILIKYLNSAEKALRLFRGNKGCSKQYPLAAQALGLHQYDLIMLDNPHIPYSFVDYRQSIIAHLNL